MSPAILLALLASKPEATGTVVVDFGPAKIDEAWIAAAVEQSVAKELARYSRLKLVDKSAIDTRACRVRRSGCLVPAYGKGGADIVVMGQLDDAEVDWWIYDTWTRSLAARGTLDLGEKMNLARLEQAITHAVRPIIQQGGLLDRRPVSPTWQEKADAVVEEVARPLVAGRPAPLVQALIVALLLFFALPLVLTRFAVGRRTVARARPLSWPPAVLIVLAATAALVFYSSPELRALFGRIPWDVLPLDVLGAVTPVAGGLAWGWLALLNLRLVFPRLFGIDRVRHEALGAMLSTWTYATLQRVLLLAVYLPIGWCVWRAGRALAVSDRILWTMVLPSAGLLFFFWLMALVDNLTLILDRAHVHGDANDENPWHRVMKKYVIGYVKRSGLDLDPVMLERLLFLPGRGAGIVTYGGMFCRPRIVIGPELRDLALGELPEEIDMPERIIDLDHLPLGTILPSAAARSKKEAKKRALAAEQLRQSQRSTPEAYRHAAPRLIGENATLLGWVVPQASSGSVPLISNNQEDFSVVSALLTEHYAAFEKDRYEDEYDDTDPTQRDFLFGALMRGIGFCLRGDTLVQTVVLAVAHDLERAGRPARWLGRVAAELWARFLAKHHVALADVFAAANQARDHLIQYLAWQIDGKDAQLTARADLPTLVRVSKEILEAVAASPPEGRDRQILRVSPRNRLVWLSAHFFVQVHERRERKVRILFAVGAAAAAIALTVVAVRQAIDYHPIFNERMNKAQQQLAEADQGGSQDGR